MKISDNLSLLRNVFVSHCRRNWGYPVGKKIDFSRLNFTFYSILEKTFLSEVSHYGKKTNTVPAHTSNSCLPVGQPVIRMLHTGCLAHSSIAQNSADSQIEVLVHHESCTC